MPRGQCVTSFLPISLLLSAFWPSSAVYPEPWSKAEYSIVAFLSSLNSWESLHSPPSTREGSASDQTSEKYILLTFYLFVNVHTCMHLEVTAQLEGVSSPYLVGLRDQNQDFRVGSKHLYLLNHLTDAKHRYLNGIMTPCLFSKATVVRCP